MKYQEKFKDIENKEIIKTGELYKKALVSGFSRERTFNHISNNFINIIFEKQESTIPKSEQELHELLRMFKNRGQYYGSNDTENIFKYELLEHYNKSEISGSVTYNELVIRTAIHEGLMKSYAIISNHSNYFSMLYKFDKLESFVFTYDTNKLNALERELRRKCYPESYPDANVIDISEDDIDNQNDMDEQDNTEGAIDITLLGIEFNLQEFALYQREWRDFISPEISLREVYDKVLMDFNDPYNYGSKRYDSTPFYKFLKKDYLKHKLNFDVCLAYEKVEKLVDKTNNKLFKDHIRSKSTKAKFKLR